MTISVAYTAVLDANRQTVQFVSDLLAAERTRRGTRAGTRALDCFAQAVLVLRWFCDGTRLAQLARDNTIGVSTAYRYLHEGIEVLADRKPSLHSALLAAKMAGHTHINIDGTLIYTDRCRLPGPTPGVDLWWSGKHHHHGGNIQVVSTPDGWPLWTSDVRPGREHDTTCLREHAEMLPALREWTGDDLSDRPHRQVLLAANIVAIATDFWGDAATGLQWLTDVIQAQAGPRLPREVFSAGVRLADPSDRFANLRNTATGEQITTAWHARSVALAAYQALPPGPDTAGILPDEVLRSVLHGHYVRAHGIDFDDEDACLHLARSAALVWLRRKERP